MVETTLCLSQSDANRLRQLIDNRRPGTNRQMESQFERLEAELERIQAVSREQVPPDVVTMNSRVEVADLDTDERMVLTVCWPEDADADEGRVSVLAPLGMAVLGYPIGTTVEWPVPAGLRRLRLERLHYQPEAAGDEG